jgi:hypothetical protein
VTISDPGQQQAGNDAGGEQVGDRDLPAGRDRIDDHVVRGRQQQRDQRGHRGDVDGIVRAIAARLHLRDHQPADGRRFRHRRAGNAAEQRRGDDVDLSEAAAHVADQRGGKVDDALAMPPRTIRSPE